MILDAHARDISELVTSYRALPWYKRLFFPRKIGSALTALPASSQDYTSENIKQFVLVYLNTSSFFKGFFNCLNRFLSTPLMTTVISINQRGFIEQSVFARIVVPYRAAFRQAAEQGNVASLISLCTAHPAMVEEMVSDDNYAAFRLAVKDGHRAVLEYLESIVPADVLQRMIIADGYTAFRTAAEAGHLPVLGYLEAKAPNELQKMIEADRYAAFRMAAANGHLPVLAYLEAKVPGELQRMIGANDYEAFRNAAERGHLPVLEYLDSKAPGELQRMIAVNDYEAFRKAAANGHLPVLKYLGVEPYVLWRMLRTNDYEAIRSAAESGHLLVLEHFGTVVWRMDYPSRIIQNDHFGAFRKAAANGHLPVLKYLEATAPTVFQEMIEADIQADFEEALQGIKILPLKALRLNICMLQSWQLYLRLKARLLPKELKSNRKQK